MDLDRIKGKRTVVRQLFSKLITKIENKINEPITREFLNENKIEDLHDLKNQLIEKIEDLKTLDAEIENKIDLAELEKEIIASDKYRELGTTCKTKLSRCIELLEKKVNLPRTINGAENASTSSDILETSRSVRNENQIVKLPRLNVPTFQGDYCEWLNFWNSFEVAIHNNDSLSNVEKFTYLKTYLKGTALSAVSGFALTNENYESSIKLLKDRFERLDLIASSHLNKLMSIEPVKNVSNVNALRKMYDKLLVEIRSLDNMKISADSYSNLICTVILQKIPEEINLQFNRERKSNEFFDVKQLIEFLRKEIECREVSLLLANQNPSGNEILHRKPKNDLSFNKPKNFSNFKSSTTSALLTNTGNRNCLFCSKPHTNHDCPLDAQARKVSLQSQGRCFICLKRRHVMKMCWKKNQTCKNCNQSHNALICDSSTPRKNASNQNEIPVGLEPPPPPPQAENSLLCGESKIEQKTDSVYLQTFSAQAVNERGEKYPLRCLCDGGSTRTFVKRNVALSLGLKIVGREELLIHAFGNKKLDKKFYDVVEIVLHNLTNPDQKIKLNAVAIDSITLGEIEVPSQWVRNKAHEFGIDLADMGYSNDIHVLIGADYIWEILGERTVRLSKRLVATQSIFGFVIQGKERESKHKEVHVNHLTVVSEDKDWESVKDLWKLEAIGINSEKETPKGDTEILDLFEQNTIYKNNRYETRLLWKEDHGELKNNFEIAKRRLFGLNSKFKQNEEFYYRYRDIINEQLEDKIIEEVKSNSEINDRIGYFMPHHAVVRECKETTRVRICYDASSKAKGESSLNDFLESGPNLNPDLLKIILKFRYYPIAFCADIQRAFLEVGINAEDRKFLQFLWGEERGTDLSLNDHKVRILNFKRVPFGVKCSPFLLAATLRLHATKYKTSFPDACSVIDELYVDDLISGEVSVGKAAQVSYDCTNILKDASMTLRKWATNSQPLREKWEENGLEIRKSTKETNIPLTVLGLVWDNEQDNLSVTPIDLEKLNAPVITKRMVLKACGMLFDPLGLFSPYSIRIKVLLQTLWEKGIQWDDPIPPDNELQFKEWLDEVSSIPELSIPRRYFSNLDYEDIELHIFSDASIKAYGAVAYFRVKYPHGKIFTTFVISKVRLAPLKEISLPRLELMGTLVSARLSQYLQTTFPWLDDRKIYMWTDSQICLHWIKGHAADWKQFVRNRVSEIQAKTNPQSWKFCSGKSNPADKLTRGVRARSLVYDEVWWTGPPWLSEENLFFENVNLPELNPEEAIFENRKCCVSLITHANTSDPLFNLDNYSKLSKVLRITAWMMRFVNNSKPNSIKLKGPLSAQELQNAELLWVKQVQMSEFAAEIALLSQGKPIEHSSRLYNLNPKIDENGLIRLGGRLEQARLTEYQKFPFIVPGKHRFTKLLIDREHRNLLHSGVSDTLVQIRDHYWITKGRQIVKSVLHNCPTCKKFRATKGTQITAPLPLDRIQESSAFEITGVDFAGPLFVSDKSEKVYIALFTCSVTRAVHLELVSNLTAENYLLAFRRFISRRGLCQVIYSDNAKTFKKAQVELEKLWKMTTDPIVLNFYGTKGIKFKYIVERAAWWGGFWERMVKITKISLRKVLGKALLCMEELQTVLVEIEAIINSRPLTYIFDNPMEPSPLTPSHFLVGKRLTSLPHHAGPSTVVSATRNDTLKRYIYRNTLLDTFWKRWRHEYLLLLRNANCITPINVKHDFQKDDVVLVKEDKLPRHLWKLARVVEVHPGRDGKVRSCTLKTSSTIIKRPVQLLYFLEL